MRRARPAAAAPRLDVVFAVLPFGDHSAPAIGVSLLKAQLAGQGFNTRVRYFCVDYAERIGGELYDVLAGRAARPGVAGTAPTDALVGEWFFARAAFGDRAPDDRAYLTGVLRRDPALRAFAPRILRARGGVEAMLDRWTQDIRLLRPRVVGFTTVFYQTCASLALARRLKALPDPPVVVFGGANCAGPMGIQMVRSFPWIDYVCLGEGDEVFPEFVRRLLREGDPSPIAGMAGRAAADGGRAELVRDLDALPVPDYTDFFARRRRARLRTRSDVRLLIETSRGCWWGAKHHCTFCGLNAETMTFRAKSAERVMQELEVLTSTYGIRRIDCVDNILHLRYLHTLFPRLAVRGPAVELFYEVKANLRREQLGVLREAGVSGIQAGIESFSDAVLDRMRKGCNGFQNIQLLRWCAELGIDVIWNILYGFPGEPPLEYRRMARLIPLLAHLDPPKVAAPIRLDRFSPNFTEADRVGLTNVRPMPAYAHVFPLGPDEVHELAYFFGYDYRDGADPERYTRSLRRAVGRWARAWDGRPRRPGPRLDLLDAGSAAVVEDTRACAVDSVHVLRGLQREAYLCCDVAHTGDAVAEALGVSAAAARRALEPLVARRLMVRRDGRYLSLAVFRSRAVLGAS